MDDRAKKDRASAIDLALTFATLIQNKKIDTNTALNALVFCISGLVAGSSHGCDSKINAAIEEIAGQIKITLEQMLKE
jgi:hypothetical protein